uniref:Chromatin assembly complex, subunit 3 n=1 Tax=Sphaerodactylus townsendi TaxID=933632 RepID=A0ACB8FZ05_9SAUR
MFIRRTGGLARATQEGLREYFSQFGEVKECLVMRDPLTKRSRGIRVCPPSWTRLGVDKVLAQEIQTRRLDSQGRC